MESLSLEGLFFQKSPAALLLTEDAVTLLPTAPNSASEAKPREIRIEREALKGMAVFPSSRNFCLRITAEAPNTSVNANNAHSASGIVLDVQAFTDTAVQRLRTAASRLYGLSVPQIELELLDTARGNLVFSNATLYLHAQREVLSIPKAAIRRVLELGEDVSVHVDGAELILNTTSDAVQFLSDRAAEEVCVISGIACLSPRSKTTLAFFRDYLLLKGPSYDHLVPYSNISTLFSLAREDSAYFVLKLVTPVHQGQTQYEALVFLLDDSEVELAPQDSRLKSHLSGAQSLVVREIFERLTGMAAKESSMCYPCTHKVFDGFLYLLDDSLQFLPKSIFIPLSDITYVEFSRINLSLAQARSFDMAVAGARVYNFTGVPKDAFGALEAYFGQHGIRMVTAVDDEPSSESASASAEESNLSDIVASDEEE